MPILTAQERVGTIVDGKIRLDRILGEGGMGVVYAGMHLRLERPVAVKFLHAQFSQHQDVVARFLTEARATSRLSHPNVIDVRDVDIAPDGCVYMVLELLQGTSLGDYLEHKGRIDLEEALAILVPVMDALAAAHDAGITHRDIKPDNIFLSRTPDGRLVPKVLDFGIAKLTDAGAASSSATATGSVMGTPMYMAPEQAMGRTKEIGAVSDVWSAAVMTYECLTGSLPFDVGPDAVPAAMILALMTATIVPVTQRRRDLPPAVAEVLTRALDRSPATRTQTMRELRDGLVRASKTTVPQTRIDASNETQLPSVLSPRANTGPSLWATVAAPSSGTTGNHPAAAPVAEGAWASYRDAGASSSGGPAWGGASSSAASWGAPAPGAAASGTTGSGTTGSGTTASGTTASGTTAMPLPTTRPWLLVAGVVTLLVAVAGIAVAGMSLSSGTVASPPTIVPTPPEALPVAAAPPVAAPVPTVAVTPVDVAHPEVATPPEVVADVADVEGASDSAGHGTRRSHESRSRTEAAVTPSATALVPSGPAAPGAREVHTTSVTTAAGTRPTSAVAPVAPVAPHEDAVEHRAGAVSLDEF